MRQPNAQNLLQILRRQEPERPTLFELFMNDRIYDYFTAGETFADADGLGSLRRRIRAFRNAGYDYATVHASSFGFPVPKAPKARSISQSGLGVITSRADFECYPWPDPEKADDGRLEKLAADLPEGMTLMVMGPGGVLENVTSLTGFDGLCLMGADEPDLLADIFDAVGSRLLRYYQLVLQHPSAGIIMVNDDWGFAQQTMLSPADMRRLVFPWHRRIVAAGHAAGRPVVLHSCGNLREVWADIIEDMRYDGKHSYEDKIQPVESAYEQYGRRIAILGGFDLDFICRATPAEIRARVQAMLERTAGRGGFAVGTGNSVPDYVPLENYLALIDCAW